MRVALVPLQILPINQAFDPFLQISWFNWKFELFTQKQFLKSVFILKSFTSTQESIKSSRILSVVTCNDYIAHHQKTTHYYLEITHLNLRKKGNNDFTCWKSSVIRRVWLSTFLVFIILTIAASTCNKPCKQGKYVICYMLWPKNML